jgi:dynein heavy chain
VEKWLRDLEKEMYESVRKIISSGYEKSLDGTYKNRIEWIKNQPSQVVAVASQIIWTLNTESSIEQG